LKEGVSIGPQIQDVIKDDYFEKLFQGDKKTAWDSFKFVVKVFWGNRRAQNYEEVVNSLWQSYQRLCCNMSLKYISFTCICFFSLQNFVAVSGEYGEGFQKDISTMEKRYLGKWHCAIVAECCRTVARDVPAVEHKRQVKLNK